MSTEEQPPSAERHDVATQEMLRAMAHPLRVEIMELVGRRGTARAADLAEEMGVAANALSYHLRTLAKAGVIEEAPEEARDRRDRVWRLTQASFYTADAGGTAEQSGDVHEYRSAASDMSLAAFEWIRSGWVRYSSRYLRESDPSGLAHSQLYATSLRLDRRQAEDFGRRMAAIVEEFKALNRDANGRELDGAPDSEGTAEEYRALFTVYGVAPRPSAQEDSHTAEG
ncbi:transcriptional regulator [Brachybacterium sp. ACRRE]|uniref:ArsR/SmtB family transcription factor n=1 Tax=Brachybacterium sp. ACRRE TaxID=2918184 RepID=UPI001EF2DAFD|nr:helix-turn-helix domain-containing protein [Brachybacterium sp. ACRRE]MCG7308476.1 helix-turn-helix domain-containing protein [Brachybacterium sp. ACRRE]